MVREYHISEMQRINIHEIKIWMQLKQISQKDLAKKIGMPQSNLSRLLAYKVEPTVKTYNKIVDAINEFPTIK